eukprot:TRINITY_DN37871_c0_g1_i1.p1 TRINITY_DN37871_c0_g1~~TRINITY_DN37871_c0_g1_i1.p1  ORF type:complete len:533 (+),score=85.67 TRINITY_DN37871_c0_g1_i1:216-1814(+)
MRKPAVVEALLRTELGPDLPVGGVRICNPGMAIGYDSQLRNPAWAAYRLQKGEQQRTDNSRRSFILDPALRAAKIDQTPQDFYTNTGFDKGHLAPSLAQSFDRKALLLSKRSPWLASYYCSNIAPQYDVMNQRAWQTLEGALHDYASSVLQQATDVVYVITGLGYWDRKDPRLWDGNKECSRTCSCGAACECQVCGNEYVVVPTFYWKVVCEPSKGSFAIIAENDPESSNLQGGDKGWPPSVFETYAAEDVETFFGLKLNLPAECRPAEKQMLVPAWTVDRARPSIPQQGAEGNFTMQLLGVGGRRVMYDEHVWLHFSMPFGPSADFHTELVISPPAAAAGDVTWQADCESLFAQQLPRVATCTGGRGRSASIRIAFQGPIKGGTFVFKLALKAPSGDLADSFWTASMRGGSSGFQPVMRSRAFELLPTAEEPMDGTDVLLRLARERQLELAVAFAVIVILICCATWRCSRQRFKKRTYRAALAEAQAENRRLTVENSNLAEMARSSTAFSAPRAQFEMAVRAGNRRSIEVT